MWPPLETGASGTSALCAEALDGSALEMGQRGLTSRIWDIPSLSNTPIMSLDGHTGNVTALQYSAQGKWIVTGSEDGTVKVWDTR